jgi:geranylgeranyl diphosphate synthase, type II
MTTEAFPLAAWAAARRAEVDALLDARLPAVAAADDPGRLVEAIRYALLGAGKRLRPLLALAAAEAVAGEAAGAAADDGVRVAAASVELVHCYSLVHDDLPAMDDDDFRRGLPSCHKVFGEATAILVGDALLTLAFEWLAEAGERTGRYRAFGRAALALARGAGMAGMVRGQARDVSEPAPQSLGTLEKLHAEKTAALFRAAAEVGAAAAGADADEIAAVGAFGLRYGVAFQHADDLADGDHASHAAVVRQRLGELVSDAALALGRLRTPAGAGALGAMAAALASRPR